MACKIIKQQFEMEITEEQLIALKASEPFASFRQSSKGLNFLLLFGGSPKIFAENALITKWTPGQIADYIRDNDLYYLQESVEKKYSREPEEMIPYITVATHMRDGFFNTYVGLMDRIERNREFAKTHGYVRTRFGLTRKLIEELLEGTYDRKFNNAYMRNLDNICANTDIQNLEAAVIHGAMVEIQAWIEQEGMKSWVFNMVHDSVDFYVYKPELEKLSNKVKEVFERALPELKGIPLFIDFDVSDINKGEYYKGGQNLEAVLSNESFE